MHHNLVILQKFFLCRGKSVNYDDWGVDGWDWESCLPYLKKVENLQVPEIVNSPDFATHSQDGPITLLWQTEEFNQTDESFLRAMQQLGHQRLLDSNNPNKLGYGPVQISVDETGKRTSAAQSYLVPIKDRPNFFLLKHTFGTKILIDDQKRAYGVEVQRKSGKKQVFYADKEVISSAGSYRSPQLLMLSGIGPKCELDKWGIEVKADLPVGLNLKDLAVVPVFMSSKKGIQSSGQLVEALLNLYSFPLPVIDGEFNLKNDSSLRPDIRHIPILFGAASPFLFFGCNANFNLQSSYCNFVQEANIDYETVFSQVFLPGPRSSGNVTLKSLDPMEQPKIFVGTYSVAEDLDRHTEGVKRVIQMKDSPEFKKYDAKIIAGGLPQCSSYAEGTDEFWRCYTLNTAATLYQPIGTCRIGADGVVDNHLRVHGVTNLRVIDASIIRSILSGEAQAATYMVAEKGADIIKKDYGVL